MAWSVTPSNDPGTPATYSGELSDTGGTIQITSAGAYDIAASPYLGETNLAAQVPQVAQHGAGQGNRRAVLRQRPALEKDTALPVAWSVTPSNDPGTPAAYSGELASTADAVRL